MRLKRDNRKKKIKRSIEKSIIVERYNFKTVEDKWQKYWLKNKTFKSSIKNKKNFIV